MEPHSPTENELEIARLRLQLEDREERIRELEAELVSMRNALSVEKAYSMLLVSKGN